jgi:hypothetical protein
VAARGGGASARKRRCRRRCAFAASLHCGRLRAACQHPSSGCWGRWEPGCQRRQLSLLFLPRPLDWRPARQPAIARALGALCRVAQRAQRGGPAAARGPARRTRLTPVKPSRIMLHITSRITPRRRQPGPVARRHAVIIAQAVVPTFLAVTLALPSCTTPKDAGSFGTTPILHRVESFILSPSPLHCNTSFMFHSSESGAAAQQHLSSNPHSASLKTASSVFKAVCNLAIKPCRKIAWHSASS